jgi:hypothetical protein
MPWFGAGHGLSHQNRLSQAVQVCILKGKSRLQPPISPATPKRTIVIGDVHGCFKELMDLLRKVEMGPEDELICVGDLICKGPDSLSVVQWALEAPNVRCVLGNHEARFLNCWHQGEIPNIKPYDLETYEQMKGEFERCMRFFATWPLYIERDEFVVVHAGLDSRHPLKAQSSADLTNIRCLNGLGIPWYEAYEDKRLVVFGHWARQKPVVRNNAIGLDTGCVYGGELSALILPERRIVSVSAHKVYRKKIWNQG